MIIDHTHPLYAAKRRSLRNGNQYNGAYYYSKEIVKYIIPNVKTDRNWVTVRAVDMQDHPDHAIIFIHNNRNPNYYRYLKDFKDVILVCGLPQTVDNIKFYGKAVYLPLSVPVKEVEKYKVKKKTKEVAYAGRKLKLSYFNNRVPSNVDILCDMPQSQLLREMAKYKKIYASGRTAIQAKILGCEVLPHETNFPDPRIWKVVDSLEAAKMLQTIVNRIDGITNG